MSSRDQQAQKTPVDAGELASQLRKHAQQLRESASRDRQVKQAQQIVLLRGVVAFRHLLGR